MVGTFSPNRSQTEQNNPMTNSRTIRESNNLTISIGNQESSYMTSLEPAGKCRIFTRRIANRAKVRMNNRETTRKCKILRDQLRTCSRIWLCDNDPCNASHLKSIESIKAPLLPHICHSRPNNNLCSSNQDCASSVRTEILAREEPEAADG